MLKLRHFKALVPNEGMMAFIFSKHICFALSSSFCGSYQLIHQENLSAQIPKSLQPAVEDGFVASLWGLAYQIRCMLANNQLVLCFKDLATKGFHPSRKWQLIITPHSFLDGPHYLLGYWKELWSTWCVHWYGGNLGTPQVYVGIEPVVWIHYKFISICVVPCLVDSLI